MGKKANGELRRRGRTGGVEKENQGERRGEREIERQRETGREKERKRG